MVSLTHVEAWKSGLLSSVLPFRSSGHENDDGGGRQRPRPLGWFWFTLANLWWFACGWGNHEKTIAQLKTGLAFHTVPTMAYAANSAWQHLVVLVHNLLTNVQIETGATRRAPTRKRTVLPVLQTIQTLRFVLFNRAAQIVRPGCVLRLRLADNEATRQAFTRIRNALPKVA